MTAKPTTRDLAFFPQCQVQRIAEAEDAPVCIDEPVAAAVGSRRHGDDGQTGGAGLRQAVEEGVAEVEDCSGAGGDPISLAVGGGHYRDGAGPHRFRDRAVVICVTEGHHLAP